MVERFHRQLKDGLRARCEGKDWLSHLPYVLLGLRAAPKEEADISSAEVTFGAPLVLPLQMHPEEELRGTQSPEVQIPNTTGTYAEVLRGGSNALQEADYVYEGNGAQGGPLTPTYSGPYKILQRGGKALQLQVGTRADWVSIDRVKPHVGADSVVPAQPPWRGRPPLQPPRPKAAEDG